VDFEAIKTHGPPAIACCGSRTAAGGIRTAIEN
jgi:hypothetical protein